MRIGIINDPIRARVFTELVPDAAIIESPVFIDAFKDPSFNGVVLPLSDGRFAFAHLSLNDGLTKLVGAPDTIINQSVGAGYMSIGHTATSPAIARVVREQTGANTFSKIAIVGVNEVAAAALASSMELRAKELRLIGGPTTSSGYARVVAHRMGLDVISLLPTASAVAGVDLVMIADWQVWEEVIADEKVRGSAQQDAVRLSVSPIVVELAPKDSDTTRGAQDTRSELTCSWQQVETAIIHDQIRIIATRFLDVDDVAQAVHNACN
ncbi:MAG: hypothetical protein WBH82_03980 [Arcanobacterium sp.]